MRLRTSVEIPNPFALADSRRHSNSTSVRRIQSILVLVLAQLGGGSQVGVGLDERLYLLTLPEIGVEDWPLGGDNGRVLVDAQGVVRHLLLDDAELLHAFD